jgi:hypothetical protein
MRTADEEQSELSLLHGKVDGVLSDTRGMRLRQDRLEKKVDEIADTQGRIETGMFELLSIARGAESTANRAARSAKAANEQSSRASWTDEFAHEAAKTSLKLASEAGLEDVEEKRRKRVTRNRFILGGIAAFYGIVMPALVTLLVHGCAK